MQEAAATYNIQMLILKTVSEMPNKKRQINTKVRITPDMEEICKQTNEGQQIVGKDKEASGLNYQSRPPQSAFSKPTQTPTQHHKHV